MNLQVNTPNIVVDDNYKMLVKRLTRRYAERGASVYTDADAIEQERSDARARAIAPDAYRISRALGDNAEMYKSGSPEGVRYMTTDDYLVYFSKCHDTFDAVNYYNLHSEMTEEGEGAEIKPRVLVNRKRLEAATARPSAEEAPSRRRKAAVVSEQEVARAERQVQSKRSGGRAIKAMVSVAASLAILVGSAFAFFPASEGKEGFENAPRVATSEKEDSQDVLQIQE